MISVKPVQFEVVREGGTFCATCPSYPYFESYGKTKSEACSGLENLIDKANMYSDILSKLEPRRMEAKDERYEMF